MRETKNEKSRKEDSEGDDDDDEGDDGEGKARHGGRGEVFSSSPSLLSFSSRFQFCLLEK